MEKEVKDNMSQQGATEGDDKVAALEFVSKKLEKIAHALYLITNHFSNDEPLKRSIRERSLKLLSHAHALRAESRSGSGAFSFSISSELGELASLLAVAKHSGLLSPINFDVFSNEFKTLSDLSGESGIMISQPIVGASYFDIKELPPGVWTGDRTGGTEKVRDTSRSASQTSSRSTLPKSRKSASASSTSTSVSSSKSKDEINNGLGNGSRGRVKSKRRDAIVSVLEKKGKSSIKDIAQEVQGCSRKTIQRELRDMIEEGIVDMEGERRWSRYFLS